YTIVTPKSPKMPGGAFVIEAYCDSPGCVLLRYEDAAAAALPTPGDVTFDCHVNMQDLALLLGAWGLCPDPQDGPCHEDLDDSGAVDVQDLLILLQNWG